MPVMSESETTPNECICPKTGILDTTSISCAKDSVFCELEGEAVILSLRDGIYYGLNNVGLRIWELIQQPRSLCGILDVLTEEYEVEREECRSGVLDLLQELLEKKMIDLADAS